MRKYPSIRFSALLTRELAVAAALGVALIAPATGASFDPAGRISAKVYRVPSQSVAPRAPRVNQGLIRRSVAPSGDSFGHFGIDTSRLKKATKTKPSHRIRKAKTKVKVPTLRAKTTANTKLTRTKSPKGKVTLDPGLGKAVPDPRQGIRDAIVGSGPTIVTTTQQKYNGTVRTGPTVVTTKQQTYNGTIRTNDKGTGKKKSVSLPHDKFHQNGNAAAAAAVSVNSALPAGKAPQLGNALLGLSKSKLSTIKRNAGQFQTQFPGVMGLTGPEGAISLIPTGPRNPGELVGLPGGLTDPTASASRTHQGYKNLGYATPDEFMQMMQPGSAANGNPGTDQGQDGSTQSGPMGMLLGMIGTKEPSSPGISVQNNVNRQVMDGEEDGEESGSDSTTPPPQPNEEVIETAPPETTDDEGTQTIHTARPGQTGWTDETTDLHPDGTMVRTQTHPDGSQTVVVPGGWADFDSSGRLVRVGDSHGVIRTYARGETSPCAGGCAHAGGGWGDLDDGSRKAFITREWSSQPRPDQPAAVKLDSMVTWWNRLDRGARDSHGNPCGLTADCPSNVAGDENGGSLGSGGYPYSVGVWRKWSIQHAPFP